MSRGNDGLTDASGFPLTVSPFEGDKAETKTTLPVIEVSMAAVFMAAHDLPDVTVWTQAEMPYSCDIDFAGSGRRVGIQRTRSWTG